MYLVQDDKNEKIPVVSQVLNNIIILNYSFNWALTIPVRIDISYAH